MEKDDSVLWLNKYIAHTGLCNRKQAVELIKKGEILVNGVVEVKPFYEVKENDIISHKGNPIIKKIKKVYLLINKPKNMAIEIDENNQKPSVQDLIKKTTDVALKPAGNYTFESCGLMVLTNDSELIEKLSANDHKVKYVFEIETDMEVSEESLRFFNGLGKLKNEIPRILGVNLTSTADKKRLGVEMVGGSDVYLEQLFNLQGYALKKKDCTFIGGLTKKDLKRGWSRLLTEKEIIFLKHFS